MPEPGEVPVARGEPSPLSRPQTSSKIESFRQFSFCSYDSGYRNQQAAATLLMSAFPSEG